LGEVDSSLADELISRLGAHAHVPVQLANALTLPETARTEGADTFDADALLDLIVAQHAVSNRYTLGITEAPLVARGIVALFGEATVGGCCGVVSLAGLRVQPKDEAQVLERLTTECMHELGHLLGRDHCSNPACVMYPSQTVLDTDRKGPEMCARCA
jgi:archaemetzincin